MPIAAPPTILIIDDTPDNVAVLFDPLREAGWRVLVCDSGEAGLESAQISPPDLILLDIMMPGLDGFATCTAFKTMPALADVPVIFMSALTDSVDKVRGLEIGAVDYIAKPISPDEVVARVRTHLQLRDLQLALAARNQELEDRNEALDQAIQQRLASEQALRRALDRAVIIVNGDDHISFISRPAERLLTAYFNEAPAGCLPAAFDQLRQQADLVEKRDHGTLLAHRTEPPRADGFIMILLEEKSPPAHPDQLKPLGLTPRETEILFWVAQAKTSGEIGVILGLAPATVKKHVESILPKLGVETRLAAALRAHELLGQQA